MKGCPLSCLWCHNPEGISPLPEMIPASHRVGNHEFSKLQEAGKYYTAEELLEIAEKEKIFINQSSGGITFSGGEPLLQPDFLAKSLALFREKGFHTAVDTSGFAPFDSFRAILPYTNLVMYDIKHLNDEAHTRFTGVSNFLIIQNFLRLLEAEVPLYVRIPVIPGYNDDPAHIEALIGFLKRNRSESVKMINLLPFHKTGSTKYRRLGKAFPMEGVEAPSTEQMKMLKHQFRETGIKVKIGG